MHQLISRLKSWWDGHKPLPMNKMMAVEYDNTTVWVKVLTRLDPDWNQAFRWIDVVHICLKDGGVSESDILFVYVHNREHPVAVPMEAQGAGELLGELSARGLLPEDAWRKAMSETDAGMHCWPLNKIE